MVLEEFAGQGPRARPADGAPCGFAVGLDPFPEGYRPVYGSICLEPVVVQRGAVPALEIDEDNAFGSSPD